MKKICVITGSRADYGLLVPLMNYIKKDRKLSLQIFVTGSHLSKNFGNTFKEILLDKFKITTFVNLKIKNDNPEDVCNSISLGIKLCIQPLALLKSLL